MNAIVMILGLVVGVPAAVIGLWVIYRIAVAVLSAGSYDDRVRSKGCDKTTMDDDCLTCTSYGVVGGRAYCSKHKIWGT